MIRVERTYVRGESERRGQSATSHLPPSILRRASAARKESLQTRQYQLKRETSDDPAPAARHHCRAESKRRGGDSRTRRRLFGRQRFFKTGG